MINTAQTIIRNHYDLGKPLSIWEIHGGYCNRSFAIRVKKNRTETKYLIRRSNPNVVGSEIKFEHA